MKPTPFCLLAAALAAPLLAAAGAAAQDYPSKPITIIVPYTAGGTTDMLARTVGQKLQTKWGKTVIVENKPGANGIIGMDLVARAPADGYTLGLASPGTHAINQTLYPKLPHDPTKDFQPVSLLVQAPMALAVNASLPVSNVKELLAYAKANPGKVSFASGGNGSSQHLAYELFHSMTKIDAVHVPYKGGGAAYADLVGGQVAAIIDAVQQELPHVKSGKLKLLAVASAKRLPGYPNLPTIAESGVPGFETQSWYGIVAPAKLPKPVLDKLSAEISAAINSPDVKKQLTDLAMVPVGSTPQQFAEHIRVETLKYGKVIKANDLKAD